MIVISDVVHKYAIKIKNLYFDLTKEKKIKKGFPRSFLKKYVGVGINSHSNEPNFLKILRTYLLRLSKQSEKETLYAVIIFEPYIKYTYVVHCLMFVN